MKHPGKTPPFLGPKGRVLLNSVAEVRFETLGGIDQWILIRGENLDNPSLILLHGGPGFSETHFFRKYCAPLEKTFTLVYWDQRGSGKSFQSQIQTSTMRTGQFITDLDELVDTVRARTGKDQVTIFGHSWGSVLGVLYAHRFPQKVSAYVGSGQIGDWPAAESASYAYALAEAERRHNREAIKDLNAIGPPPYPASSLWTERTWLQQFEGQLGMKALWHMARDFIRVPELSILDLFNLIRGFRFSLFAMWDQVSGINLIKLVPDLKMPVFFFLGRRDRWVPPETSVAYLDRLNAPEKKLVWFNFFL